MLDALKFVQGAVSKKDFVPALSHFQIRMGRITGFNGKISMSAPIALDIDCHPEAAKFAAAIEQCTETAQLSITKANKLCVRSGKFRANVDILADDVYPEVFPEGESVDMTGELLPALRIMHEFTTDDASKQWAAGLLLDGNFVYATNNVIIVQHWTETFFPFRINIPRYTVKEMLRIGEEPIRVQATATSITFHYSGERWLRSQVNSIEWPDTEALFAHVEEQESALTDIPDELFIALDVVESFLGKTKRLWIGDGELRTAEQDGASYEIDLPTCSFNHSMLGLLRGVATRLAFSAWPAPMLFYGKKIRGVIAGMKG